MKLNKEKICSILNARFESENFFKLNQIPKPSEFKDLEKSAKRVKQAIERGEKITLIGDYDVDGVVSTAIVKEFFNKIDYPLEVIIPNRFKDGYGISPKILERVNSSVVITVDNGISAIEAGEVAKKKNIDLIITDHHTPPEKLPKAFAIVNPKLKSCPFPFSEICGATIAWYLIAGLKIELNVKIDLREFFDILSLAIIADVMPLIELNRVIVKEGINTINRSKRPSIIAMKTYLNRTNFNSEDIAFQIAPRINCAGRLKDASLALNFLLAKKEDEAFLKFEELDNLNNNRKELESEITNYALNEVESKDNITIVYGKNWHEGIIGIVAARLVDKLKRPSIVFSIKNGIAKGSARSYGDIDILSLIENNKNLLLRFGGHKGAAGLSLKEENLKEFKKKINDNFDAKELENIIDKTILGEIDMGEVDFELIDILQQFEPYGEANPKPKFISTNSKVYRSKAIGKNREHLKLTIFNEESQTFHEAIAFKCSYQFKQNDDISFSYTVSKNEFKNNVSIQLIVDEILT